MRSWTASALLLLGLGACRQPNPQWQGPAGSLPVDVTTAASGTGAGVAPTTSGGSVSTGSIVGTSGAETTGSLASSSTTSSTTGLSVETEGLACNNNNGCPAALVCGPEGCQRGEAGDPCDKNRDCQPPTGRCGPLAVCQAGIEGDPCDDNGDCGESLRCDDGVCG